MSLVISHLADIFRDSLIDYIASISISNGLGSPEEYTIYINKTERVDDTWIVVMNVQYPSLTFNNSPVMEYIEDIGLLQLKKDIKSYSMEKMNDYIKKHGLNMEYDIDTHKDMLNFDIYLKIRFL